MFKLLKAGFIRLFKNKTFWFTTMFMFGLGLLIVCLRYSAILRYNESAPFDSTLLEYVLFIGCCSAIFSSMFLGTEYSDGTIRNKLIVGHMRSSVYLSNWTISVSAAIIMIAAFLAPYCALGVFLLDAPISTAGDMISLICISIFTAIAYASVYNMLGMLITKKSASAVLCLILFLGLCILAGVIQSKLNAPEFIQAYNMTSNGIELPAPTPNPKYLQPDARKIYQFVFDALPTGQSIQLSEFTVVHPYLLALYSTVISIVTTAAGIFVFRKKDLK